ncbi:hypothetical protein ACFL26_01580 [Patescibacteria group bacterium]
MPSRRHREERVLTIDSQNGYAKHFIMSWDNRRCAVIYESCAVCGSLETGDCPSCDDINSGGLHWRYVFDGKVCSEDLKHGRGINWSLSFDGQKLATTQYVRVGHSWHYEVRVNGEQVWTGPDEFYVYQLEWLPGGRLIWYGWFDGEQDRPGSERDRGHRTYEDGREVTDKLRFSPVIAERSRHGVIVQENGRRYFVNDRGEVSGERECSCKDVLSCHCGRDWDEPRPERPEEVWDREECLVRVRYRGQTGPQFHDIESGGGMRTFALSEDRRHHAYIGIRYAGWARQGQGLLGRILESHDRDGLLGKVLGWPAAFLANPYFGPLHVLGKSSRRWYPVLDGQEWSKGYKFANDHFVTPDGELVVTGYGSGGPRVVIDEDEGPTFDDIMNVCYLARRGDELIRVVV